MNQLSDVMIDIETLGTSIDCIILSIAAVEFDRFTGETGREFHEHIFADQDRKLCFDTLLWWAAQPKRSLIEALSGTRDLKVALVEFANWWDDEMYACVWSQGIDFDFPIIEHAMSECGVDKPWKYWRKRDTRTVYDICGFDTKSIELEGACHNALDDCKHQIKCVVAALDSIQLKDLS